MENEETNQNALMISVLWQIKDKSYLKELKEGLLIMRDESSYKNTFIGAIPQVLVIKPMM